jgi:hypothetical protein
MDDPTPDAEPVSTGSETVTLPPEPATSLPVPSEPPTSVTSTTTTTTEKAPTLASENLHSVPLLVLALAFLTAIVTLLMFERATEISQPAAKSARIVSEGHRDALIEKKFLIIRLLETPRASSSN